MVHLIFPSGSISMSHQERTTWAWPDARGSNCLLWQAAELLTCLLKSTLWKNIQELKYILSSHTPFLSFYGDLTSSEICLQWTPAFSGRWHQLASFPLKKNFQRPQCHQMSQSAVTQLAPWYLNIGSTLLSTVKSVGETWFSWMSQTEGAPGHLSSSEGGTMTCSPHLVWTRIGNSLFHDHIFLDSTSWA